MHFRNDGGSLDSRSLCWHGVRVAHQKELNMRSESQSVNLNLNLNLNDVD